MKDKLLKWINILIYTQEDTLPEKQNDPELFESQSQEIKELKSIKEWVKKLNH